ncbi:MAG TPA: OPT family oligopeptide transporter [Chthoniobacterales bacterium]|nr:OPT family oligopeptide transporter [Chthoniobacterales bacterium]
MALAQLTPEQTRTWTREEKDRWWFEKVYRGDLPQLTIRSGLTGFLLGGILSATNLYVAGKTGVTLGVNLTSVILAFAMFRFLARIGLGKDFTILENNAMQSIATSAGYMTVPLTSSLAAYMLVTNTIVPWWHIVLWMSVMSLIGVLIAFPLKRRFINEDQLPFPEGRACGVVLDALYHGAAGEGIYKAKLLGITAGLTGFYQFIVSDGLQRLFQFKLLRMNQWLGWTEPWHFRERIDEYYYMLAAKYELGIPRILGTEFRTLGLRLGLDAAMFGVGGLMGVRVATSVALGTAVNFFVLAPIMIARGDIAPRIGATGATVALSRAEIVNQWSLWWGVTMMVVGSLIALVGKPEIFTSLFKNLRGKKKSKGEDVLAGIELPLWISYVGVPILSLLGTWLTHLFFGVPIWLALLSLPLVFVLTVICVNSMALTSWTPTSSLSKITQFSIGAIDRTNPASNLITAGMTAEVASNAGNLLSDIKPGYMLGAKPRQQAIGHCIGIFSGALAATPLFFLLFLPPGADGGRSPATIISEQFPMPSAVQWKGVADLIARGVASLPASAVISMIVAAALAAFIEIMTIIRKKPFPLSSVSIGLGVILPPEACFAMWLGAMFFWWQGRRYPKPGTKGNRLWVESAEPICAGLIAGAALVGIANALVIAFAKQIF